MNQRLLPHKRLGRQGPWLLLIHGYMVDGGMFAPVESVLAQHYRLIIPDLRGYGSAWNWEGPYTFSQRVQDLAHLIHAVAKNEPVWVMGYSMGGALAQLLVRDYSELVQGVILACTFAYKPATTLEQWQGRLLPRLLRMLPLASIANLLYPQIFGSEEFPPEIIQWYKRVLRSLRLEVILADAENIHTFDGRPYLRSITKPTLVVGGTSDFMVPTHHSYLLAENIPKAHLLLYPNAGHALILTHRRPLVRDVHRFILQESHKPGSPNPHSVLSQSQQ
ncbi:MAG: alpha/beta hydrolase [Bacteroidia bacterium]|nr:alpha/beta hydrolase [Bacteroidia bacterium]